MYMYVLKMYLKTVYMLYNQWKHIYILCFQILSRFLIVIRIYYVSSVYSTIASIRRQV